MINRTKRTRSYVYWLSTALVMAAFTAGGVADLLGVEAIVAVMDKLGYPTYLAPLLGTWKMLGALALASTRRPLLREWAYAGMFFDLTGAAYSHVAAGDALATLFVPALLLALLATSYALRPDLRASSAARTTERAVGFDAQRSVPTS